jgi:hypothetical protein
VAGVAIALVAGVLLPMSGLVQAKAATASAAGPTSLLHLNRLTIDTTAPIPTPPPGLAVDSSPTSWIVQLNGVSTGEQLEGLRAAGFRIVAHGYIPDNGWLVRGRSGAAEVARTYPWVSAVIPYQPWYRVSPRLDGATGIKQLRIQLFDDVDLPAIASKLTALGATELGRIDESDVKFLRVNVDASLINTLARMDAVQWIEPVEPLKLFNDHAADTLDVRPMWTPGAVPGASGDGTLQGQNQIVGIADTGLDTGNTATMHPDFAGRVKALQAWARIGDASDPVGHGTHTAGSLAGDGSYWTANISGAGSCTASCNASKAPKGMAPKSQIVFQSIADANGNLVGIPDDPGSLFGSAYDLGARVHSDSYGIDSAGEYDAFAFLVDRFEQSHPDMLLAFAAGNAGVDGNHDGKVDLGSIGSPATAKDVLAVGASEDSRGANFTSGEFATSGSPIPRYSTYGFDFGFTTAPIANDTMSNNAEGMAAFSSRGPTTDGRIKPDITAIGTHVLSTRSSLIAPSDVEQPSHYWSLIEHASSAGSPTTPDYPAGNGLTARYAFDGGTSMATPLAAGIAADLRQYLTTVKGFQSPSASLLKAALTAGAHEMQGQYGSVQNDVDSRPDNNEGWGRVDLAGTVAPAGVTTSFVDDPSV